MVIATFLIQSELYVPQMAYYLQVCCQSCLVTQTDNDPINSRLLPMSAMWAASVASLRVVNVRFGLKPDIHCHLPERAFFCQSSQLTT